MVSRPGLGDRPLFVVGVGGQYAVRIKLAMGDFAGRIPLMVEGVSTMRLELGAYDSDPTTLQVTTTVEQVTEGVWQGLALWDTKLPAVAKLASNFGQHTCLRLTLPAKGKQGACFKLQQEMYMLVSHDRGRPAGWTAAPFQRSQAFYQALRSLDWALESIDGAVGFAKVVRRPSSAMEDDLAK